MFSHSDAQFGDASELKHIPAICACSATAMMAWPQETRCTGAEKQWLNSQAENGEVT